MTTQSYHESQLLSRASAPESQAAMPGFQLPQAELVHETAPHLFDDIPREYLTEDHLFIRDWSDSGDRMILADFMPVEARAQRVARILLWQGWASAPSRSFLERMARLPGGSNVSHAVTSLVNTGILIRRQRNLQGQGYRGNMLVFSGIAVCRLLVEMQHPTMGAAARRVLEHHCLLVPEGTDVGSEDPSSRARAGRAPPGPSPDQHEDRGEDLPTPVFPFSGERGVNSDTPLPGLTPRPEGERGVNSNTPVSIRQDQGRGVNSDTPLARALSGKGAPGPQMDGFRPPRLLARGVKCETSVSHFLSYDVYDYDLIDIYTYQSKSNNQSMNRVDLHTKVREPGGRGVKSDTPPAGLTPRSAGDSPAGSGSASFPVMPGKGVCPSCDRTVDAGVPCRSCAALEEAAYSASAVAPCSGGPPGSSVPSVDEPASPAYLGDIQDLSLLPAWYQRLAAEVRAENLPGWRQVYEDQTLGQWGDDVMAEAVDRYVRYYSRGQVTAPGTLFRKIAQGVFGERLRSGRGSSRLRGPPHSSHLR